MIIPIGDDDRHLSSPAVLTYLLIGANLLVFFLLQQGGASNAFTYGYSVVPYELTNNVDLITPQGLSPSEPGITVDQAPGPTPIYLTVLSAMFMHGGYLHLFGNLLYLWIFGDNIEHRFGRGAFLLLYFASGIAGTVVQVALAPESVIPNLGASGAISGVMGAYLMLFPRNRVRALFFFVVVSVPAVLVIGLWIVMQIFEGFGSLGSAGLTGGVAYGAHVGGFFAGAILATVMRRVIKEERASVLKVVSVPKRRRGKSL
jgi:membrane associated rhomboid family serine protease